MSADKGLLHEGFCHGWGNLSVSCADSSPIRRAFASHEPLATNHEIYGIIGKNERGIAMSMHHEVGITCPKCQKAGIFTVWDSINTKLDPDMKDRVKSQEAFCYHCPHCGTDVHVDYGFLYHDMDHHFMVFYAPTDKDQENADRDMADGQAQFKAMVDTAGYVMRLVRTKADLLEKIAIFEAGLDDRLMELTKAAALAQVGEKEKDFTVTESHFVTAKDGALRLSLVDEKSGQQAYVDFNNGLAQLYGQFQQHFADDLPAEDAVLARIDADWTQRFLNKYLYN